MLILALDTTSGKGGVGIYRDLDCLAEVANDGPANLYSVTLFQMVDHALEQARGRHGAPLQGLRDVELFAVANGPGSFTGIRVGVAATLGWAKAFARPACSVSVLEALVEQAQPDADRAAPILDARRGEFFLGLFHHESQPARGHRHFSAEGGGWVLRPHALTAFLRERLPAGATVACLVREHDRAARTLAESLPHPVQCVAGTLLGAIARLALQTHQRGRPQPPAELDALYIRRPDAELNWRG